MHARERWSRKPLQSVDVLDAALELQRLHDDAHSDNTDCRRRTADPRTRANESRATGRSVHKDCQARRETKIRESVPETCFLRSAGQYVAVLNPATLPSLRGLRFNVTCEQITRQPVKLDSAEFGALANEDE